MKRVLLLAALAFSAAASAQTLRDALASASARAPLLQAAEARRSEMSAQRTQADAWFAGAPALEVGQRTDRPTDNLGKREFEIELTAPLWLPGQRASRQDLVEAERSENELTIDTLRLGVAGELRNAVWAASAAKAERQLASARAETARQLEDEVARRVQAGDLARTDLLLAQAERFAAETAELEAESKLVQAQQRYMALTGLTELPNDALESRRNELAPGAHPRVEAARRALARAQVNLQVVQDSRRDAPELAVQYQRGRDEFDSPTHDSVRVGIKIPFGTDGRNQPLLAAANTEITKAQVELRVAEAAVDAEIREAKTTLANAERAATLTEQRETAANENLGLTKRAFDLGELPLVQLLRVQALAQEAQAAHLLQKTALALAIARVNQAQGLLP